MLKRFFLTCFMFGFSYAQIVHYNHPELDWQTFETEHFKIHYYDETEPIAREGAFAAEEIYPAVTKMYEHEPNKKTHIHTKANYIKFKNPPLIH